MPDYLAEKERAYQEKVKALFLDNDGLNYKFLGNFQYAKNAKENSFGKTNSYIIDDEVTSYLLGAGYTQMQVESALHKLKEKARLSSKDYFTLVETNTEVYNALVSGIKAKPSKDKNEEDVMFFNFNEPLKNNFAIAEEVSYIDPITGCNCRPDIVVYVNGIALAVIELKRSFVSLEEGIKQNLSNEKDLIPSFFTTTQFTIAANEYEGTEQMEDEDLIRNVGFKYGTIGTPLKFWCRYKHDTNRIGIALSDTDSYKQFFDKARFLTLFRYGVINDGGIKKVMRPHQLHALFAAKERLEKKASGVIWHSQGSGKSLTMIWLAKYISDNFENPRVLVITDRTELDKQIHNNFIKTQNSLHQATSQLDLLRTLNEGKEWLICSLIHKFGKNSDKKHTSEESEIDDRERKIPLDEYLEELLTAIKKNFPNGFTVKGDNIFVFIDECHRTQGGRLHEAMRAIMGKDVMLIGFTGTPLLKAQKVANTYDAYKNVSEVKFGSFIHKYLHKQAVEDKVILDLQYEARDVEKTISDKKKLDEKLAKITEGLTDERVEIIKRRWATLEKVYSSKNSIEKIGYSILDDIQDSSILKQDWCNAMLIAGSIGSAYRYYEFFQSQPKTKGRCAVVTSYNPSEYDLKKEATDIDEETESQYKYKMAKQSFKDLGVNNSEEYEEKAKALFITQPSRMKLLIVVDKLLTGFDAPTATFLYLDQNLKDHNLFQAICRVNRLGTDIYDPDDKSKIISKTHKEFGMIVDFKHSFNRINDAVTTFNDEDGGLGGFDPQDIEDLLDDSICKNKKRLLAAYKAFKALKGDWERLNLKDIEAVSNYYVTDFPNDNAKERREALYKITSKMATSYDNLADYMNRAGFSKEEANMYQHEAQEAAHINKRVKQKSGDAFDVNQYDPAMRALLDRYINADEAETIVQADASFTFLKLIDDSNDEDEILDGAIKAAKGNVKAASEIIEGAARAVINNSRDRDEALFERLSEKLQVILDRIHTETDIFKDCMRELIKAIKEAQNGGVKFPEGITSKCDKALWNNRAKWFNSEDEQVIVAAIIQIAEILEFDAGKDWKDAYSRDAALLKDDLCRTFEDLTEEQITVLYKLAVQNS